jgi:hypothetical protein
MYTSFNHIARACIFLSAASGMLEGDKQKPVIDRALDAAVDEGAEKTIPLIIQAGAKPTNALLKKVLLKTIPLTEEVSGRKTPENFDNLKKNMRIIRTFYANGATESDKNLSSKLTWLIEKFQDGDTFRDKDIKLFNTEFSPVIAQIKGEKIPEPA